MESEKIWDKLRKKWVVRTPEEDVRQWFIDFLLTRMQIPKIMMMSEVALKYGQYTLKKDFRADILVYDRKLNPLMVVECKRPEVELDKDVLTQVFTYNMVLKAKYLAITNGKKTYLCKLENDTYVFLNKVPVYLEMIGE